MTNDLNTNKTKVLVIDDERSICVGTVDLLDLLGFEASFVLSAQEGLNFIKNQQDTDIVLLDINLGQGMRGIELIPLIKEKHPYTQIIMFTSQDDLDTGIDCMKKGAFDYMTKPFQEEIFVGIAERALKRQKLEQMKDLYLGIIVHDMRNPIQNIMIAIENIHTLGNQLNNLDEGQEKSLTMAKLGAKQINAMVNNILQISQFEKTTQFKINKTSFDLKESISKTLEIPMKENSYHYRPISINYPDKNDLIQCSDESLLMLVLWNLVCNALRFTPKDGEICININLINTEFLQFEVSNTGSYIEPQDRLKIFEKFYDVGPGKESQHRNFGMGLTFSKIAIESLGGEIWAECELSPKKTTFFFKIPK